MKKTGQGPFRVVHFKEDPRIRRETLEDRLNELRDQGYFIMSVNTLTYDRRPNDSNHGHGVDVFAAYQIICHEVEEGL